MFKEKYQNILIILTLIFLGSFLRIYQLNFEDYWLDEHASFWISDPNISLKETFERNIKINKGPHLIFALILKLYFKLFSYSPEIGRAVPLIFGILSIPAAGFLSYQIQKNKSYLLSILFVSLNIYLINYSQELRSYSFTFFLSILNLIFYYKFIEENKKLNKFIYGFLFSIISIIGLSTHIFVFLILISQIFYSFYNFIYFKKKFFWFLLTVPIIIISYAITNYESIITQISLDDFWINQPNWDFFYNYFFSIFFGSRIMGIIYLLTLLYLLYKSKNLIFLRNNKILLLIFILFFSYFLPLVYGIINRPILTDRYIIFVLIPILLLISILILELNNKKIKYFILSVIIFSTLVNNYIEVKYRKIFKPEFNKAIKHIKNSENLNITHLGPDRENFLIENYILSIKNYRKENIKYYNLKNIPNKINKIWIICYKPLMSFNCRLSENLEKKWKKIEIKNFHLIEVALYKKNDF